MVGQNLSLAIRYYGLRVLSRVQFRFGSDLNRFARFYILLAERWIAGTSPAMTKLVAMVINIVITGLVPVIHLDALRLLNAA
jgi:hypothetical protein